MNLHALTLARPTRTQHIAMLNSTSSSSVNVCVQATKDFFEVFISMDPLGYTKFSLAEWCRLIHATMNIFMLLSHIPSLPDVDPSTVKEVLQFDRYLEILCFRMQEQSASKRDASLPPDIFCLWESVLRVVREKFNKLAKEVAHNKSASPSSSDSSSVRFQVSASLCPVIGGGIKETEYWDAWTRSMSGGPEGDSGVSTEMMDLGLPMPLNGDGWDGWNNLLLDGNGMVEYDQNSII